MALLGPTGAEPDEVFRFSLLGENPNGETTGTLLPGIAARARLSGAVCVWCVLSRGRELFDGEAWAKLLNKASPPAVGPGAPRYST